MITLMTLSMQMILMSVMKIGMYTEVKVMSVVI